MSDMLTQKEIDALLNAINNPPDEEIAENIVPLGKTVIGRKKNNKWKVNDEKISIEDEKTSIKDQIKALGEMYNELYNTQTEIIATIGQIQESQDNYYKKIIEYLDSIQDKLEKRTFGCDLPG